MVFAHCKLQGFWYLGQITRGMQALHKNLSIPWDFLKAPKQVLCQHLFWFSFDFLESW